MRIVKNQILTIRLKQEKEILFSTHKVSFHYDRVEAWENGEKIAPISVDMALTRACGAMCHLLCNGSRTARKS